jgi:hypothetical protein
MQVKVTHARQQWRKYHIALFCITERYEARMSSFAVKPGLDVGRGRGCF